MPKTAPAAEVRLLIFGSRSWSDPAPIEALIRRVAPNVIIHGGAPGADCIGGAIGRQLGIPVLVIRADWKRYGRAAGPMRNQRLIDEHKPTCAGGFRKSGASPGTDDMHRRCLRAHIPTSMYLEETRASTPPRSDPDQLA